MRKEEKAFVLLLGICVLAVVLGVVIRERNVRALNTLPSADVAPAPPKETPPSAVPAPKTFTSADGVTTVAVDPDAWSGADGAFVIDNPSVVTGTSTTFESNILWKMTDADGAVVSQGYTTIASPDVGVPGPFTMTMFYDVAPKTATGTLTVYEASAKDGTPIHDVSIPVRFRYAAGAGNGCETVVRVAFSNSEKDPGMPDCSKTYAVERRVCGLPSSDERIALHELLKGPTAEEKKAGYLTSLPDGVPDPRFGLTADGRLLIDFDRSLEAGVAGSCRVIAIRAQIENTMLLNTVQTGGDGFVIGVDGRTEDILQP